MLTSQVCPGSHGLNHPARQSRSPVGRPALVDEPDQRRQQRPDPVGTRPLEDAYRVSQRDPVGWAAELTGRDTLDAYQLVSQAGLAPAGNVVDTDYTMVAELAKRYLPGAGAFDGVHARLRDTTAAHLAQR